MVKQSYENKGFRDLKEINLPLDIHGKYGVLREYEGRKVGVKDGSEQIILRGFIRLNKDEEMYYLILDKGTEKERTRKMRTSLLERFFIPFRNVSST